LPEAEASTQPKLGYKAYLWNFDAPVIGAVVLDGVAGFGLGDGSIGLRDLSQPDKPQTERRRPHATALLSIAAAPDGKGFISGGDDGRLMHTPLDAEPRLLAERPRKWIEQIAVAPEGGLIAFGAGKEAALVDMQGRAQGSLADHPSTVAGLAFNPKGKRLAVAHYNGTSLWWAKAAAQTPKRLTWRGSHVALSWSPNGRFLITATQENELHGWRTDDFADMRMSGYPAKPRSLSWSADGKWLATSGAESVICWHCAGKGPMGSTPLEMNRGALVMAVAFHPKLSILASGDAEGGLTLGRISDERSIPLEKISPAAIACMGWSGDGRYLAIGAEDGAAAIIDFEG
jgi:WD40 repeat protein